MELSLEIVTEETKPLFNEIVVKYHGYTPTTRIVGRTINYLVNIDGQTQGVIGFQNMMIPAPKALDGFIGWPSQQQPSDYVGKKIKLVANNWRFTLKPEFHKGWGSRVLSMASKRISSDWTAKYGNEIALLYTLVGEGRTGIVYQAANWELAGQTSGWVYVGGTSNKRYDTKYKDPAKVKLIYVYPLVRNWRKVLGVYKSQGKEALNTPERMG